MSTSVLKSAPKQGVGQAKTVVLTAGATSTMTVIGLLLSNVTNGAQHGSAFLRRASIDYSIITNAPIPVGNTLAAVGEDGKVVLMPNDSIVTNCDTGTMDVIVSYLEQTP